MLTMAVGHSDDVDPADAIATAIEQCRAALGDLDPQAGILFAGFESFDPAIVAAVRVAFPGASVMGCTSSAELSSLNGFQEGSLALAMFASDAIDITVGIGSGLGRNVDAACRAAAAHALAGTTREPRICIALVEGFNVDPQLVLDALARALPEGVVILGGTSARNDFTAVTPTYQFCDDVVVSDGLAVLLLSGPVKFSTAVGTGWRTIGPVGTVTRSQYGAIHEVDGLPAIDFLARYLDVTGPAAYGNPLSVREVGTDESYLRAISGSDPATGSVLLAGSIPVGAAVQLTTADIDQILSGTRDALERASAAFPAGSVPEAGIIFSCAVRKFLLGSRTQVEAQLARSELGPTFPMAGMYCFGEIGPVRGAANSRYLNETFVTLLLGT
jgi:hypothetical protein